MAGLYPTATIIIKTDGNVLVTWTDITYQVRFPFSDTFVEVVSDPDGQENFVIEVEDLPPGQNFIELSPTLFQNGTTYLFEVGYFDNGGVLQLFEIELVWPPVNS